MSTLSKNDKIQLIDSRSRGLEYKKYSLELDLIVENAKSTPSSESVSVINAGIAEVDDQLAALNEELAIVNALTE
jgi:hypothetical protein